MKRDADFFDGCEPVLVYIAKRLKEAMGLEIALSEAGVDYGVEADEYRGGVIFNSVRTGAFFYVRPESADMARQIIADKGLKPVVERS